MSGPDLTGRWAGAYFYAGDALPPTAFTAALEEVNGHVSGLTAEPDSWHPGRTLEAEIEGQRTGTSVAFTKLPDGGRTTIEYVGEISPDGQSVVGTWAIIGDWSGTFRMDRRGDGASIAVTRTAQAG